MTIYEIEFLIEAKREWDGLDAVVRSQFKKLEKLREEPRVPGSRLRGAGERYKIKLRKAGFRLVYEIDDHRIVILIVAVGKREGEAVYRSAARRPRSSDDDSRA